MKAPICGICLNSDMLCIACMRKLDEGKISENDVKISRLISEAARDFGPLNDVAIKRVVEGKTLIVVVCGKGDVAKLMGREGMLARKLSKLTGKNVRIIEESGDVKEFMQNLLQPVPVIGINVLYREGEEVLKVIIPAGRAAPIPEASFAEIVRLMFGKASVLTRE